MLHTSLPAPTMWCLTGEETLESYLKWRQQLLRHLKEVPDFVGFVTGSARWKTKYQDSATRGLSDDGGSVHPDQRKSAVQKVADLNIMLHIISVYCPILSRGSIINRSRSLQEVFKSIDLGWVEGIRGGKGSRFIVMRLARFNSSIQRGLAGSYLLVGIFIVMFIVLILMFP